MVVSVRAKMLADHRRRLPGVRPYVVDDRRQQEEVAGIVRGVMVGSMPERRLDLRRRARGRSVEALARSWDVGGGRREGIRQPWRAEAVGGGEERTDEGRRPFISPLRLAGYSRASVRANVAEFARMALSAAR